ncbi:MAG: lysylphosphatidylglycerol synthase domain-containing protein [Alphaproteobacteria bacterium]
MTASWPRRLGLAVAVALLVAVLATANLGEAARLVAATGWGVLAVFALSAAVPAIDTITWALALEPGGWTPRRSLHLFNARLVGEAFNAVLPAAGFGGEPIKAVLLARRLDVGYHQGSASIVLARVVNMLALIPFLIVGVALIPTLPPLPAGFAWLAAGGVLWFALATLVLFAFTRFPLSSGFAAWGGGSRGAVSAAARAA